MQFLFFWMLAPVDASITEKDWGNYLNYMGWVAIAIVFAAVALIGGAYSYAARRRRIHTASDLFRGYGCRWWVLLAVPAGIGAGIAAWLSFPVYCGETATGVGLPTVSIGGVTVLLSLVIGYAIILLPGVTPRAFKYRPRELPFSPKTT